jgi:RNA polymerase sigma-70 factor (ECF subfamily)
LTPERDPDGARRFELLLMPHLSAGFNLARWLTRSDQDAEDLVQEAYLRAFRSFDGFRGGNPRAWLLSIVRNTCYSWLRQRHAQLVDTDAEADAAQVPDDPAAGPEAQVIRRADGVLLRRALDELPVEYREAIVLRELEGMSYKEIAEVAGIPLGTVMSRLARGRRQLQHALLKRSGGTEP